MRRALLSTSVLLLACGAQRPTTTPPPPAASAPVASTTSAPPDTPSIVGTWRSECEPRGGTSRTQEWRFTASTWSLDFVTYAGDTCGEPFVTIHEEGTYQVGAPSSAAPGAWELRFDVAKKTMTPHVANAAQYLASPEGCGFASFAPGVATDMTKNDCTGLGQPSLERCKTEYDLVQRAGDALRLGARGADACTPEHRPRALLASSLTKKP